MYFVWASELGKMFVGLGTQQLQKDRARSDQVFTALNWEVPSNNHS